MQCSTWISMIFILFMVIISVIDCYGQANCICNNSPKWTRDCCGPTGGYFAYRKCYNTFGLSFIECCRYVGLRGACVA